MDGDKKDTNIDKLVGNGDNMTFTVNLQNISTELSTLNSINNNTLDALSPVEEYSTFHNIADLIVNGTNNIAEAVANFLKEDKNFTTNNNTNDSGIEDMSTTEEPDKETNLNDTGDSIVNRPNELDNNTQSYKNDSIYEIDLLNYTLNYLNETDDSTITNSSDVSGESTDESHENFDYSTINSALNKTEDQDLTTSSDQIQSGILNELQNILQEESNDIFDKFDDLLENYYHVNSSISSLEILREELDDMLDTFENKIDSSFSDALEIFQKLVSNFSNLTDSLESVNDAYSANLLVSEFLLTCQNKNQSIESTLIDFYKEVNPRIYEFVRDSHNLESLVENLTVFFGGNVTIVRSKFYAKVFSLFVSSSVLDYNSFLNRNQQSESTGKPETTDGNFDFGELLPITDLDAITNDTLIMDNIKSYISKLLFKLLHAKTSKEAVEMIEEKITEQATPEVINAMIDRIKEMDPNLHEKIINITDTDVLLSNLMIHLKSVVVNELKIAAAKLLIDISNLFGLTTTTTPKLETNKCISCDLTTTNLNQISIEETTLVDSSLEPSNETETRSSEMSKTIKTNILQYILAKLHQLIN